MNASEFPPRLPSGESISALGQGTWGMAENASARADEIAALRIGIDLGLTVIDTAEMYAFGDAERLVGEAVKGRRDEVFLISKVLPHNATRAATVAACERSLRRLGTDRIDLYLVHWRGPVPLRETVAAMTMLRAAGKIRHWGVSNFDREDLVELVTVPDGDQVAADEVLYNLYRRGVEWDVLPTCQATGLPMLAYAPFERGLLLDHPVLVGVARRHNATPARVALAWILRARGVATIVKASTPDHVKDNVAALDLRLEPDDLTELDRAFPAPTRPVPLEAL